MARKNKKLPDSTSEVENDENETPEEESAELADPNSDEAKRAKAVSIATQQCEESMRFKQPRMIEVRENESVYLGKKRQALRNRFNVPFDTVVMQGAVDTVLAKSDDSPKLSFEADEEEYKRSSMKVTAAFRKESGDAKGRWASKDRLAKKMAYLSGRAIFEKYTTSAGGFKDVLKVEDHYNFQCEPGGGSYLEDHLFCGTINNFFTKDQLLKGVASGLYDKDEVEKLINQDNDQLRKETENEYNNAQERLQALGLDLAQHNYVGQSMFNLTKWEMEFEGERMYLLFDMKTGACVRFCKLKEVSASNRWSWVSWASHEDVMFWSRAFADTVRPIAEVYRVLVNLMLENIQKRSWNMRAYDPAVFTDSAKLLYSPDGLVKANLKPGMTSVSQGIFELQTPETTSVTLNAIEWLNNFLGEKTGITPGSQGNADDQKVGIYFGNVQQTAERFGLLNKQYLQAWIDLGILFDWGLYDNVPEDYMVKILGLNGVGWEALKKEDVEPDYQVNIVSSNAQAAETELKAKKQQAAISLIFSQPSVMETMNKRWLGEEILRGGEYDDEAIRVAMDTETDGNREVLLHAAEAIRKIVDGQWPVKLCYAATTGFMQKIVSYSNDHWEDFVIDIYHKLNIYAMSHSKIVAENMVRKAMIEAASKGVPSTDLNLPPGATAPAAPAPAPTPSPINMTPTSSAEVQARVGM